jgi:hypothetical protein
MSGTGWQPIATAPEEVKRNEPVLLLVHSITATPGPEEATRLRRWLEAQS